MHIYMHEIYIYSYPRAKKIGDVNMLTAQVYWSRPIVLGVVRQSQFCNADVLDEWIYTCTTSCLIQVHTPISLSPTLSTQCFKFIFFVRLSTASITVIPLLILVPARHTGTGAHLVRFHKNLNDFDNSGLDSLEHAL